MSHRSVAILTGGGDAVGLNAAIAAATRSLCNQDYSVFGIIAGWKGLSRQDGGADVMTLDLDIVDGIAREGGTIIHTSREDPRKDPEKLLNVSRNLLPYERPSKESVAGEICAKSDTHRAFPGYTLIAAGGDDTLGVATTLAEMDLPVIGIPKTMDLDLGGTDYSVGFWSYVESAVDLGKNFITTCKSHRRVGVLEVFGRHSGFTAGAVGMALDADFIIIPEFELDLDLLAQRVAEAFKRRPYGLVVVEEGLKIESADTGKVDDFGNELLRDRRIGEFVAAQIEKMTGIETRSYNAGHPHRGNPGAYDAIAGFRLGLKAAELVKEERWGMMAALVGDKITAVPLQNHKPRRVVTEDSYWGRMIIGRNQGDF